MTVTRFQTIRKQMIDAFRILDKMDSNQLIEVRRAKFSSMGTFDLGLINFSTLLTSFVFYQQPICLPL